MSVIDELITDRTQQDVDYVKSLIKKGNNEMTDEERTAWISGMKGAYNAKDLNRVEEAIAYLAGRLVRSGYSLNLESESWCLGDIPPLNQWQLYLNRVRAIKNCIVNLPTTPELPLDIQGLTYEDANAIEQILIDIDRVITLSKLTSYYTGEIYSGEGDA